MVKASYVAVALALVGAGFGWYSGVFENIKVAELVESGVSFVEAQGDNAVLAYMAFTYVGVVCLVSSTLMEFAGGFLFAAKYGFWATLGFTTAAKLAGNVTSVWLARNVLKDFIRTNLVEKSDILKLVAAAASEEPYKVAFLVRGSMAPIFVKNYGLGVLDLGYMPIIAASSIFAPFFAYQNIYFGSACQDLKEIFAPKKPTDGPSDWQSTAKSVMPMLFNVMLVVFLIRAVKQQIKKQRDKMEAELQEKKAE